MDFAQFVIDLLLFLVYTFGLLLLLTWLLRFWKMFAVQQYNNGLDIIMLEVKIPREIDKSPLAMEIAMNAFLQAGGVGTFFARELQGKQPAQFSLEIASLEGVIHFYIRTERKYKPTIEASFYSQYPGIEISEADDYTSLIRYTHLSQDVSLWGARHKTDAKWEIRPEVKMPADFKPIKTYVDYGLDKDPKEEYKNDPITPLLEFLGSMKKGEYAWYQVMVQEASNLFDGKKKFPKMYVASDTHERMTLSEMAKEYTKNLRKKLKYSEGDIAYDEYGNEKKTQEVKDKDGNVIKEAEVITYKKDVYETKTEQNLTAEEKDEIEAINKKLAKPQARALIRILYVSKKDSFNPAHIQSILGILRPYNSNYNYFAPSPTDPYDYPWEDTFKRRKPWRSEEFFNAFVEREGFFPHITERKSLDKAEDVFFFPYPTYVRSAWRLFYEAVFHPFAHPEATQDVCTLNLEELASLWHFPGRVAQTPTLPRIDSTKGVAPVNLPTM